MMIFSNINLNRSFLEFSFFEIDIVYKFDTESLLEYYSGILSLSGLEKITGIHQKQLWNYLHRKSKPRRAQVEKIEKGKEKEIMLPNSKAGFQRKEIYSMNNLWM